MKAKCYRCLVIHSVTYMFGVSNGIGLCLRCAEDGRNTHVRCGCEVA